jgi:Rrf2 family protein
MAACPRITHSTSQSSANSRLSHWRPRLLEGRGRIVRHNGSVRVSAKADYALRAAIELAVIGADSPVKGERIAQAQKIPLKFLENILGDLRHAGIVRSQRGVEGGYWLARPADEITVADVIRAVEGPIANVRGVGPEQVEYAGSAERLREVWIAVRANLRAVLERVTIADLARGELPVLVEALASEPDAWQAH